MDNGLSIKKAFEERQKLESQAERVWRHLALRLALRIPERLIPYAQQVAWIEKTKPNGDNSWYLPKLLNKLVSRSQKDSWLEIKVSSRILAQYGFRDFQDLRNCFQELEQAWLGLVHIKVRVVGDKMAYIDIKATEISPDLSED